MPVLDRRCQVVHTGIMNRSSDVGTPKQKADRAKLESAKLVNTSVLQVKKSADKTLDLRSPDEFKGWQADPDDIRSEKKAKKRKKPVQEDPK